MRKVSVDKEEMVNFLPCLPCLPPLPISHSPPLPIPPPPLPTFYSPLPN
ncbi:hypothetical protein [Tolypothrix sp. VBCCA 56010]